MSKIFLKVGAGLAFISVALWFFVFSGLISGVNTQKQSLIEARREYKRKKDRIEKLRNLKKEYNKLESEVSRVNEILPSGPNIPSLLVELKALVRESGVELKSIDYEPIEEKGAAFSKLRIRLSFAGTYDNFKSWFLTMQEKELRLMDVKTIKLDSGKKEKNNYELELITYYQGQQ